MTERPGGQRLEVPTSGLLSLSDDEGAVVAAELVYRPRDCLAVTLVLHGPGGLEVRWTFAWVLLAAGLAAPSGDGDITVRPDPGPAGGVEVVLAASSPIRMWLPTADVARFVRGVRLRAPFDTRRIAPALEQELAQITGGV